MSNESPPPEPRAHDIFFAALNIADPTERSAFLHRECAAEPAIREWVEKELRRQTSRSFAEEARRVSEWPLANDAGFEEQLAALKPEEPGDRIGLYTLLEQLGEGGFGVVWRAQQEKPVHREVALKVIKIGMDTKQVIFRFEQERQALAMLDHPGIAKVHDAGVTRFGRPYFVMELVRGKPITAFCEEARLSIEERLELAMRVCYAVQHAHQKGIIHRDLKPSNILVSEHEGVSVPKVIDLGLAKATERLPSEHTLLVTHAEQMLGTPLYMSPEQAEGSLDLDTRTDIFSLGVVLYELLLGQTPFDPQAMSNHSHGGIQRAIREGEPQRPSSVLRSLPEGQRIAIASGRSTDLSHLVRVLRGDLDWIAMKALEKDRRRRYASASAFASDIQHFLLDEPVTARPPTLRYRVTKAISRNHRAFTAAAVVLAAILLGSFISVQQALRARGAEAAALAAREQEAEQRSVAERQREQARLNEYIADIGLAQQSLQTGNLGRAVQLLRKHRYQPGENDVRGWEWRYLSRLSRGDELASFPPHRGPASAVAFSPDGKTLAIGGMDRVTIYDAIKRTELATLSTSCNALVFSRDGQVLITSGRGAHIWRTSDWTRERGWRNDSGPVAISRDGSRLAVVGEEGVRFLKTGNWEQEQQLPDVRAPIAFSPDGRMFAGTTPEGVALWTLSDGHAEVLPKSKELFSSAMIQLFRPGQGLVFSADGAYIAAVQNTASPEGVFLLRLWDARSRAQVAVMPDDPDRPEHTGVIRALDASPDGRVLATASMDHTVRLWDLQKRRRSAVLYGHRAELGGLAFAPDGETLVTCDRVGEVKQWRTHPGKKDDALPEAMRLLGFSTDARTFCALMADGALAFCDSGTKRVTRRLELEDARGEPLAAVSADLATVAQALDAGRVKLWKTATGEVRTLDLLEKRVDVLALTPDGEKVIFGTRGEPLRMRDLRTEVETVLPVGSGRIEISANGRIIAVRRGNTRLRFAGMSRPAVGHSPGQVEILDLEANKRLSDVAAGSILSATLSADGRHFATANSDKSIELWDTASGSRIGAFEGHKQLVRALAFSHDGKTFASASDDGTVRIWNVATQQELLSILHLGDTITDLCFQPDDHALAVTVASKAEIQFHAAPPF